MFKRLVRDIYGFPSWLWNVVTLKIYKVEHGTYKINGKVRFHRNGKYKFGDRLLINSAPFFGNPVGINMRTHLSCSSSGELIIGDDVGISGSTIVAWKKVVIENHVLIGGGCQIYDTDFHSLEYKNRKMVPDTQAKVAPVLIKEGVFIGGNSIILKGVTIGRHSVIGAGSVVTRDVPDGEIWAGNPARFIKKIEDEPHAAIS